MHGISELSANFYKGLKKIFFEQLKLQVLITIT